MGVWGTGILSDDVAEDVRDRYRALLEDQVPDEQASRTVLAAFSDETGAADDVVLLALAATQSSLGRLEPTIRDAALRVIDSGRGAAAWAEGPPRVLRQRQADLDKLRDRLLGPQPPRRVIRPVWRDRTDLVAGDVLQWTSPERRVGPLRVVRVEVTPTDWNPVLEMLSPRGVAVSEAALPALPDVTLSELAPHRTRSPGTSGPIDRDVRWQVARCGRRDPDWRDVGLTIVGRGVRVEDSRGWAGMAVDWPALLQGLSEHLRSSTG